MAIRRFNGEGIVPTFSLDIGGVMGRRLLDSTSFDIFGSQYIYPRTMQIGLKSAHGTSAIRDYIRIENGGSVTNPGPAFTSDITCSTTSAPNSSAKFETVEWGRYQPTFTSESIIGVRLENLQNLSAGQTVEWGYFNDSDGMGFGVDTTGAYVFYQGDGGPKQKFYQSQWNCDNFDGLGYSKQPFDLTKEMFYCIDYVWAGFVAMEFSVVGYDPDSFGAKKFLVHRQNTSPTNTNINPNLPIAVRVNSGASGGPTPDVLVSCRSYSILGEYHPHQRHSKDISLTEISLNATSWTHIISFRKKSTHRAIGVRFDGYEAISSALGDVQILVMVDTQISGGSWGNLTRVNPIDTAIEVNRTASLVTPSLATGAGAFLHSSIQSSGNTNNKVLSTSITATYMGAYNTFTIVAKGISASAALTLQANFAEEW